MQKQFVSLEQYLINKIWFHRRNDEFIDLEVAKLIIRGKIRNV